MAKDGYTILNYIDDQVSVRETWPLRGHPQGRVSQQSAHMARVEFDGTNNQLRIPPNKRSDMISLVSHWRGRNTCFISQLKSLLCKLLHITECSYLACLFLKRMLTTLRNNVTLDTDVHKDLAWFYAYLHQCNGVFLIRPIIAFHQEINCNPCLSGCGAIHAEVPPFITSLGVFTWHLEALSCVISFTLWGPMLAETTTILYCDSMVAIQVLSSAKG